MKRHWPIQSNPIICSPTVEPGRWVHLLPPRLGDACGTGIAGRGHVGRGSWIPTWSPCSSGAPGVKASARFSGASRMAPTGHGRGSGSAEEARILARALRAQGLAPGDRVLLVAENRPEWLIADLAIMAAGGITVPAYTTNTAREHAYLLAHSGATAVVVVATTGWRSSCCRPSPRRRRCGWSSASSRSTDAGALGIPQLVLARGAGGRASRSPISRPTRRARSAGEDTACFIYTSGTGGLPKGVMLSHGNVLANVAGASRGARPARPRRARGVPVVPAAVARLRAHRRASSCRSRSARRSTTPTASRRCRPTCSRRGRRSWPACRGSTRSCASGSSMRSRASAASSPSCSPRRSSSAARPIDSRARSALPERLLDRLLDRLVRAAGAGALRRPRSRPWSRAARRSITRSACSSPRSACRCSRATARPNARRW